MAFQKATKRQSRLRLALVGPSGSGKTYTALNIAKHLGDRVAVVDTERGSASKYADEFAFDAMELETFHPQKYIGAIHEAEAGGYDVLIIDSLSHAWMGKDGALEQVDRAAKRSQSGNTFGAWREVTPLHNALVDAILQAKCHIIVTMRAKTEYVLETNERGKQVPRKVGMAPVQRDGLEYEFDVVADLDLANNFVVSKSRCKALTGAVIPTAGKEVADTLRAWLTDGAPVAEPEPAKQASAPPAPTVTENKAAPPPAAAKPATTAEAPHPNKNKLTEALCKSIYIQAEKVGIKDKQALYGVAQAVIGVENDLTSLYDLGDKPEHYRKVLEHLATVTSQSA